MRACDHTTPTFGCRGCVLKDHTAQLAAAKLITPAPKCPDCERPTVFYDGEPRTMTLSFTCTAGWTEQGEPICEGWVEIQV